MTENQVIEIGERLKKLRESLKMSQDEFCATLDIMQANLSKYERGKTLLPANVAVKIFEVYHIKMDYLFFGIGEEENIARESVPSYGKKDESRELAKAYKENLEDLRKEVDFSRSEKQSLINTINRLSDLIAEIKK
jgi:transcriptional regulator with XRE-family HTH domain